MTYVSSATFPPVTLTALTGTPQNITVNLLDWDTLYLDVDFTYVAGTALVFTFKAAAGLNATGTRTLTVRNDATQTLAAATYTFPTGSASGKYILPFSLTGLPITATSNGNITIAVSATNGTTDAVTIVPMVARVGG